MNEIKDSTTRIIYEHERLLIYSKYAALVIQSIFDVLLSLYDPKDVLKPLESYRSVYPTLMNYFIDWIVKYSDLREIRSASGLSKESGKV